MDSYTSNEFFLVGIFGERPEFWVVMLPALALFLTAIIFCIKLYEVCEEGVLNKDYNELNAEDKFERALKIRYAGIIFFCMFVAVALYAYAFILL